ncbi:hypothetical protein U1Q18_041027 [Sarracenia purpurea var. burkii]
MASLSERVSGAHSPTPAPAPAPAPSSHSHGGSSPSAAAGFSPHLFISTPFAFLALIFPLCLNLFY